MRRLHLILGFLVLVGLVLAGGFGCQKIKKMLPASTIDNPGNDEPEFVIRQYLQAAMMEDEKAAWKKVKPLIHSKMTGVPSFRSLNWAALRRKWDLYVHKGGDPCRKVRTCKSSDPAIFKRDYDESPSDDMRKVFVVNFGNPDNPTPCILKKDPNAGSAWRLWNCSL